MNEAKELIPVLRKFGAIAAAAVLALAVSGVALAQIGVLGSSDPVPAVGMEADLDIATAAPDNREAADHDISDDEYDAESDVESSPPHPGELNGHDDKSDGESNDASGDDYDDWDDESDEGSNEDYDDYDDESDEGSDDYYDDHSGSTTTTTTMPSEQSIRYEVADAGVVWITFDGYRLRLDDVMVNDGWYISHQQVGDEQIQIEFHNGSTKVEFEAQPDNGQVKIEIVASPDDDDYCSDGSPMTSGESIRYEVADAAVVWITFDGYRLTLDDVMVNDGWYISHQQVGDEQIQIEFHNGSTKVEFEAQPDNGQVKLKVVSSPDA